MYWTPPGQATVAVPGANLSPRYGLVTSTTDPDGKVTKTEYDTEPADGPEPELGH